MLPGSPKDTDRGSHPDFSGRVEERLARFRTRTGRIYFALIGLLFGGIIVLAGCNYAAEHVFQRVYGRPPSDSISSRVREGMTQTEVVATVGEPHTRYRIADGEDWRYYLNCWATDYNGVHFDAAGRVTSTWYP